MPDNREKTLANLYEIAPVLHRFEVADYEEHQQHPSFPGDFVRITFKLDVSNFSSITKVKLVYNIYNRLREALDTNILVDNPMFTRLDAQGMDLNTRKGDGVRPDDLSSVEKFAADPKFAILMLRIYIPISGVNIGM